MSDFSSFFRIALGADAAPYPYQQELAQTTWPGLLSVPTGLGKTASIAINWLWKLRNKDASTPRRLVYCLPMRVLVEQTGDNSRRWIENLNQAGELDSCPAVHVLMGGEEASDWDMNPDVEAIIVGTQDQLLSRALNRGYSMSRFRWPVHFGLLNNDCLWVFDEVQLMGVGLSTSAQLQAFRNSMGTMLPTRSLWMSATIHRDWLRTKDYRDTVDSLSELSLGPADLAHESVVQRLGALKPLLKAPCSANDAKKLAAFVLANHAAGSRTLVVRNTVKRAQELFEALRKAKPSAQLVLLHSRFRPPERKLALDALLSAPGKEGTICVATQVVEAGVDVSARLLVTDLAPWASLIQRFGRCNRDGVITDAQVFWIPFDLSKTGEHGPYETPELELASTRLGALEDVGILSLRAYPADPGFASGQIVGRKDLVELFDTTPDLAGADIDVSRFIRESQDLDLQAFWREPADGCPEDKTPGPTRDELCSVPVGAMVEWTKKKANDCWTWEQLTGSWVKARVIAPGMTVMLKASQGGYSEESGWTGIPAHHPRILTSPQSQPEAYDDDKCTQREWQTLTDHSDAVTQFVQLHLKCLGLEGMPMGAHLVTAARWHDSGKGHELFRKALVEPPDTDIIWAKAAGAMRRYERKGFRHELASALAMLDQGVGDLAAYLVAAHHGKVRLSIRSLPHEKPPSDSSRRFARGIWEGDELPAMDLGGGVKTNHISLDLSYMELGAGPKGESWTARMLALRDAPDLGPFRLGFLEALLRVADWKASSSGGEV